MPPSLRRNPDHDDTPDHEHDDPNHEHDNVGNDDNRNNHWDDNHRDNNHRDNNHRDDNRYVRRYFHGTVRLPAAEASAARRRPRSADGFLIEP